MKRSFPTLLLILSLCTCGLAQNLIGVEYGFGLTGWASWNGINTPNVSLRINGQANNTPFWGSRSRIQSRSGDRAVAISSPGMVGDTTRFRSPSRSFVGQPDVYLSFHQYYRRNKIGTDSTHVWVELYDNTTLLRTIPLNEQLVAGVETAPYDTVMLHVPELIGVSDARVVLASTGPSYFWLIDDVAFFDSAPLPLTPDTLGQYLGDQGYPYRVSPAGGAYVPNQLVIQFAPDASPGFQDSLREEFGARAVDSCACDFVKVWEIDGSMFISQGGQQEDATGTTDILSNIIKAKSKTMVDGVDLNTYNLTQPVPVTPVPSAPLTTADFNTLASNQGTEDWSALRIAILDTGIDYEHLKISPHVKVNRTNLPGSASDNLNCLEGDAIGWNYVDKNNNPYDDNGHGTHVAGIIADSLDEHAPNGCGYEFLSYKTHDYNGVSTLFAVACATFQASLDDIDIINDSWGFFGDSSIILGNAIDTAATRNILIISAAGNEGIDLRNTRQYPACYSAPNVITVAATQYIRDVDVIVGVERAGFSNFSPLFVDITAPGVDIFSARPRGGGTFKSGTSMATPMVTAEAAIVYACLRDELGAGFNFDTVRTIVLNAATPTLSLEPVARDGKQLVYTESCVCDPVATTDQRLQAPGFEVYPNPGQSLLFINSLLPRAAAQLRLLDGSGRLIYEASMPAWAPGVPQSITLPRLSAGIYFLQINGQDYQWTEKLLRF
ncbi:S8 family peptidase [Neolewinella persica]|uniref:S8 family peptidase n=1 Tax=Neolewinella persica TaxID=70998 RepID=UPI00038019C5|nr:S8 family peptidase [Neolewinella persica]